MALTETARAKINLALRVCGRRTDGYHELCSIVAFTAFGDSLSLIPGNATSLQAVGPFADDLGEDNLILRAVEEALAASPGARSGAFQLTKRTPVAAGLGGGSADAAASLRLLAQANPGCFEEARLMDIAASLGADVPVCLGSRPALMSGIGEAVAPLAAFPDVAALLVNPGIAVATGDVFAALSAPPLSQGKDIGLEPIAFGSPREVADAVSRTGNDLEAPAVRIAPVIGEVKAAIAATDGCLAAAMSGSGATCFGLYEMHGQARRAADALASIAPDWWTQVSMLCAATPDTQS